METSPLIRSANHWTGFYMISASVMKGLHKLLRESNLFSTEFTTELIFPGAKSLWRYLEINSVGVICSFNYGKIVNLSKINYKQDLVNGGGSSK